nr:MAG TPA: hypothetical protein [Caudoviricetes sp.]
MKNNLFFFAKKKGRGYRPLPFRFLFNVRIMQMPQQFNPF